jgi:hypothetical protein
VNHDFFDERAVPGGFLDGGHMDTLLAVVSSQGECQSGLPEAWVPSIASTGQFRIMAGSPAGR